jgi:hypothetical protein
VRRYVGLDASLVEDVGAHAGAICRALTSAPGSSRCEVIATREGLIVISVGEDEVSVVEAGRRFVAWAEEHMPALRRITPDVWAGEVLVDGVAAATAEGGPS